MRLPAHCATRPRFATPIFALRLPLVRPWQDGITVVLEVDGGNTVTADMDGSGRCSGRSLILTFMTMRSGATVLVPRSGAMATMTFTPACLHPTATMTLRAICRHAPRQHLAPPRRHSTG